MKTLLAATALSVGLILVGAIGGRAPSPIPAQPAMSVTTESADAATDLVMWEKQPDLVPYLFSNACFMAATYKRYQMPASALDDTYAAAGEPDAHFLDTVYASTGQPCPGSQAARTAQNTPALQTFQ